MVQDTPKGRYVRRATTETLSDTAIAKVLKVPDSNRHGPGRRGLLEREQEADANARILAAAPDLLAACELFTEAAHECVALLNSKGYACPSSIAFAAEQARHAIEKAHRSELPATARPVRGG
jgi:hypothetical protein